MEISPVAGIRVMSTPKARPVDSDLTALFDIESAARPDDDTYTSNHRKAAGAEETDEETDEELEQPEEAFDDDPPLAFMAAGAEDWPDDDWDGGRHSGRDSRPDGGSQRQISYFA